MNQTRRMVDEMVATREAHRLSQHELALEATGGGSIDSFGDALWRAVTTVTTVGYGDTFPVTPPC